MSTFQSFYCRQEFPFFGGVQMDVFGQHLIIVSDGKVKIFEKMTGKELHSSNPLGTRDVFGIKMLENVGVVGAENGNICFLSRKESNQEWREEKVFSGVHEITHIEVWTVFLYLDNFFFFFQLKNMFEKCGNFSL